MFGSYLRIVFGRQLKDKNCWNLICVMIILEVISSFWHLTLTFDLKIYFHIFQFTLEVLNALT